MTTSTATLRCGVVGVGKMGRHHARLWTQVAGCDLVGVVDSSAERRQQMVQVSQRDGGWEGQSSGLTDQLSIHPSI